MFTLTINTDNAAFGETDAERAEALADILRREANHLLEGRYVPGNSQTVRDFNGNDVGRGKIHA